MNKEIWKDIKDYEGLYQVSNLGRVKSLPKFWNIRTDNSVGYMSKERILKPGITKLNYQQVSLCKNKSKKIVYIHRLVAETFIPNPNNYNTVNHIDGNKHNNRVDNLEWCSQKENVRKAWEIGLCKVDEAKILSGYILGKSNIGKKKPRKNKQ